MRQDEGVLRKKGAGQGQAAAVFQHRPAAVGQYKAGLGIQGGGIAGFRFREGKQVVCNCLLYTSRCV